MMSQMITSVITVHPEGGVTSLLFVLVNQKIVQTNTATHKAPLEIFVKQRPYIHFM